MPLKSFRCQVCGASAPKAYLRESQFKKRMKWLRGHYKRKHPREFRKWYK